MKSAGRFAGALLTMSMIVGFSGAPADALVTAVYTRGSRGAWDSTGDKFRISDTKCDGNPVYLKWQWSKEHDRAVRLNFDGGCGSSYLFGVQVPSGASYVTFQACENVNNQPDDCSAWTTVRT